MARSSAGNPVVILSRYWGDRRHELSYVIRSLAGAASRHAEVTVLVPGDPATVVGDGAFEVKRVGAGPGGDWPSPDGADWTDPLPGGAVVVVDELNPGLQALLATRAEGRQLLLLSRSPVDLDDRAAADLPVVLAERNGPTPAIGMHVPVNPLAATHHHNGFGFVDYVLVLSDRVGDHELPPDGAAWLTAGLPLANVVVVENAKASVWRGRALRGVVSVDSRTDLWRLLAHARVCVDLAPGAFIARECVEALRFGTPIVVPGRARAAAVHADGGGGLTFDSMADLLHGTRRFDDARFRSQLSEAGRNYADSNFGNASTFVDAVQAALLTPS